MEAGLQERKTIPTKKRKARRDYRPGGLLIRWLYREKEGFQSCFVIWINSIPSLFPRFRLYCF